MVKVGDKIWCRGIVTEIAEIVFQDDYDKDGLEVEFIDTEGKCRVWKQRFDGGYVFLQVDDVSENVVENVRKYFTKNLPQYFVCTVARASSHPDDHYLYTVIAKHRENGTYTTWTSWNETTQCLNFGHYGLDAEEAAVVAAKQFNGRW